MTRLTAMTSTFRRWLSNFDTAAEFGCLGAPGVHWPAPCDASHPLQLLGSPWCVMLQSEKAEDHFRLQLGSDLFNAVNWHYAGRYGTSKRVNPAYFRRVICQLQHSTEPLRKLDGKRAMDDWYYLFNVSGISYDDMQTIYPRAVLTRDLTSQPAVAEWPQTDG